MKNIVPIVLLPLSIFTMYEKVSAAVNGANGRETNTVSGHRFILQAQVFESHDASGTTIDTVTHAGDYIVFSPSGKVYMNYDNQLDSIDFMLINTDSVSFGDTPFRIIPKGGGFYYLYQHEQEPNGDYNRVTYLLKNQSNY